MSARVAVVGGGITGLAAAWALRREVEVAMIEPSRRLGGKILTEQLGAFLVEGGPDSFLTLKPAAVEFAQALGIGDRLVGTREPGGAFVLYRGRLHPLPEGLASLVPQRLGPFLRSGLFSPLEKARFALDLVAPVNPNGADESLGAFIRRRLGEAAVDRLAAPLLAGIHAGDVDRLSLRATFPQLAEAERRYGSLTRAVLARRSAGAAGRPRLPMFMTLRGGLRELVEAAARAIGPQAVRQAAVTRIAQAPSGYSLTLDDGETLRVDALVLTVPAPAAARLLREVNSEAAGVLPSIPYASTAAVVLALRREDVGHPLAGHGYVTARGEGMLHAACTWVSSKWPDRAPPTHVLLRAYVGRAGDDDPLALEDSALTAAVLRELTPLLGIRGAPVMTRVYRWPAAMAQYLVGHLERVAKVRAALQRTPGIVLAGAAYEGVGIPDCIRQGREAAAAALRVLSGPPR